MYRNYYSSGLSTFLLVLTLIVVVVGLSRGWFAVSGGREAGSNKVDVNFTVDPDKVKTDVETMKEKADQFTGAATSKPAEQDHPADVIVVPKKY